RTAGRRNEGEPASPVASRCVEDCREVWRRRPPPRQWSKDEPAFARDPRAVACGRLAGSRIGLKSKEFTTKTRRGHRGPQRADGVTVGFLVALCVELRVFVVRCFRRSPSNVEPPRPHALHPPRPSLAGEVGRQLLPPGCWARLHRRDGATPLPGLEIRRAD